MKSFLYFFLIVLCSTAVFATSIGNVPTPEDRDIVVRPGFHHQYTFSVGGANLIDVTLFVPRELSPYITLQDDAPRQGPRSITVNIDFPNDIS